MFAKSQNISKKKNNVFCVSHFMQKFWKTQGRPSERSGTELAEAYCMLLDSLCDFNRDGNLNLFQFCQCFDLKIKHD